MLLGTCGMPFVKETASEEYRNFEPLCQVIRVLGRQLLQRNRNVQLAASQMLVAVGACLRSGTRSCRIQALDNHSVPSHH